MKLKTWHLFLVIIILFGCSFYIVNLKFDKFYRLNGINNDNRVLIEKYLSEDEQDYLIENQIDVGKFIKYIENDSFYLNNHQYYYMLEKSSRYDKQNDILETGNSLSQRLSYLFKNDAVEQGQALVDRSLEMAFLNEENFQFAYIDIYKNITPLYEQNDYSYVKDVETYVQRLHEMGITNNNDLNETFAMICSSYNKDAIQTLLTTHLASKTKIVFNPKDVTSLVDKSHYIGVYEPSSLILTQDIPRMRYAMYLKDEAYNALVKMHQGLSEDNSHFLLMDAYTGYQTLDSKDIGYKEEQLGLTIKVMQSDTAYKDFEKTNMSKWLEKHAYEYGYVLRYPRDKASVTDRAYDSHIYRYVGVELAKKLFDSQMTLEEYYLTK
ncbi:MAG: M15 family metallopeptidase [Coprobacillus sp.]